MITMADILPGQTMRLAGFAGAPDSPAERRLRALGLEEGCRVTLLHRGPFGGDPMIVQVDEIELALRRSQAASVLLEDGS